MYTHICLYIYMYIYVYIYIYTSARGAGRRRSGVPVGGPRAVPVASRVPDSADARSLRVACA